jgi:hypothetical protein
MTAPTGTVGKGLMLIFFRSLCRAEQEQQPAEKTYHGVHTFLHDFLLIGKMEPWKFFGYFLGQKF